MLIRLTITDDELTDTSYLASWRRGVPVWDNDKAYAWNLSADKAEAYRAKILAHYADIGLSLLNYSLETIEG